MKLAVLALAASATASSVVPRTEVKPVLALRGGAYPPPKVGYHTFAARGAALSKQEVMPNLLSGSLAGFYVSFGAIVSLSVAGSLPGLVETNPGLQKLIFGVLFPIALLNIIATGCQLFTGNSAMVAAALYEGLITPGALVRNWVVTYAGNTIGSLLSCWMFTYSGLLSGGTAKMAAGIAVGKCKSEFGPQIVKSIFANWLVCLAAFMATVESDLAGKIMGVYSCISAFVLAGFEHSVANLFLLPLGMNAGAEVSAMDVIMKNVVPVTIGNTIAGAIVFAASYSYMYGKLGGHSKD